MGKISKTFAVFLTLVTGISSLTLLITNPVNAQSIPPPSIPEFTVKRVPSSYTVTTTNPYTGENTTQQHDNSTIEISITNQPYTYSNGSTFYLYYAIRTKGHFEANWAELYPTYQLWANAQAYRSSNYMTNKMSYIAFTAEDPENSRFGLPQTKSTHTFISLPTPASSGQVDFQVKAMVGTSSTFYDPGNNIFYDPTGGGVDRPAVAYVTGSDWSNTKTVDLADGSVSSSTPNPSPTVPESSWLAVGPLLLSVFAVAVVVRHRKTADLKQ